MIGQLAKLSRAAAPAPFHNFLKVLDSKNKLFRVYTQNIDGLEEKCGLSYGIPESHVPCCIPLHGHVQTLLCTHCKTSFEGSAAAQHTPTLISGSLPVCLDCKENDHLRRIVGMRSHGIGRLRPRVVLYNEDHTYGESIAEVVHQDLVNTSTASSRGADLLLVVGTSLKVPGTKHIVQNFARALHCHNMVSNASALEADATPSSFGGRLRAVRTIYLNQDFPMINHSWDGVFDAWVQGDAQCFAQQLMEELSRVEDGRTVVAKQTLDGTGVREVSKIGVRTSAGIVGGKRKAANSDAVGTSKRFRYSNS